jgi:glycosyltransferase involved in cell wall biosynthesis
MSPSSAVLAIASRSFDAVSETFIYDHARLLAPNSTILVCQERGNADRLGYPILSNLHSTPPVRTTHHKLSRLAKLRWQAFFDPARLHMCVDENYAKPSASDRDRLHSFLNRYRPISLLAEYGPMGLQLADVCVDAKIPLFVHFHGWDANILGESRSIRRAYRRLFEVAAAIIVTTEFLQARLRLLGCPPDKLRVCPCGVDTESFRPGSAAKAENVLMVSRLVAQKGPDYSLASFAAVAKDHPQALLEVIGDGPLRGRLAQQAAELGISKRTVFHGACSHDFVRDRMKEAAVFIQHSVTNPGEGTESLGLSILEAMASGVPVVATRHGAVLETVEHGVTGYLVGERETTAMADAMKRLLRQPAEAAGMGAAGRRRVIARYSQDFAIKRLRYLIGLGSLAEVA